MNKGKNGLNLMEQLGEECDKGCKINTVAL